jgi:hypothetical protein
MSDISATIQAKSDQINADDLIGKEITAKITKVVVTGEEQPVTVHLDGYKHWRPSKTDRRVLAAAWGTETDRWVGQWVHLYRDPEVKFGGMAVGGIRVGALTGIGKALKVAVNASKGKKVMVEVRPLKPPTDAPTTAPPPDLGEVLSAGGATIAQLDAWRSAQGKPETSTLTDAQRAQLAGWLAADPARVAALIPTSPEPEPDEWDGGAS